MCRYNPPSGQPVQSRAKEGKFNYTRRRGVSAVHYTQIRRERETVVCLPLKRGRARTRKKTNDVKFTERERRGGETDAVITKLGRGGEGELGHSYLYASCRAVSC